MKKYLFIVLALGLGIVFLVNNKEKVVPVNEPIEEGKASSAPEISVLKQDPVAQTNEIVIEDLLSRYDESKDPLYSVESKEKYFNRIYKRSIEYYGKKKIDLAKEGLSSNNDSKVLSSLGKVRKYGLLDSVAKINELLNHENHTIAYSALKTLLYFDEKSAYDFLLTKISDDDAVNWQLQDWFIKNNKREYIEPLRELLNSENTMTRSLVATVLASFGDKVEYQKIIKEFPKSDVSSSVIYAIAQSGDKKAIDPLKNEFQKEHSSDKTKVYIAYALSELGVNEYQTYLDELVQSVELIPPYRVYSEDQKRYVSNKAYKEWVKSGNPSWNQVDTVISLMGEEMQTSQIDNLKELLVKVNDKQTSANIAKTVINQIAKSETVEAFNALIEIYSEQPKLRNYAINALLLYKNPMVEKLIAGHFDESLKNTMEDKLFYAEALGWRSLYRTTH
tara:strand:- start:500 stop:1843 length:1344 start_codon:yes stop_codon:yes gene_type:complete